MFIGILGEGGGLRHADVLLTRGGGGVSDRQNRADVIYGSSLTSEAKLNCNTRAGQ